MDNEPVIRWKEGADERIAAAIAAELDTPNIVMGYVVVVDAMNEAGERDVLFNAMSQQMAMSTLGLLDMGRIIEEQAVKDHFFGDA